MLKKVYDGFHKIYHRMHNGKNFEIVDRGDAVNVLIVRKGESLKKDTFFIGSQYRSGPNKCICTNVAGMIDQGESPMAAARREAWEEFGAEGEMHFLGEGMPSPGGSTENIFFFVMFVDKLGTPTDLSEGITVQELSYKTVKKMRFTSMQLQLNFFLYKQFRKGEK